MDQYFEARRVTAVRLLAEKGVPRWKSVPASYRFFWSCGIKLRPPHFSSWETNFAFFGGTVGGIGAVVSWLAITAVGGEMALLRAAVMGVGALVVCGFSQAARHKREAEDHGLPPWDELPDVAGVFD
jgi:hypothetical protein